MSAWRVTLCPSQWCTSLFMLLGVLGGMVVALTRATQLPAHAATSGRTAAVSPPSSPMPVRRVVAGALAGSSPAVSITPQTIDFETVLYDPTSRNLATAAGMIAGVGGAQELHDLLDQVLDSALHERWLADILLRPWAELDPAAALAYVVAHPDRHDWLAAVGMILDHWCLLDDDAAWAWTRSVLLAPEHPDDGLTAALAARFADRMPRLLAAVADDADGPWREALLRGVADRNPAAAAAVVNQWLARRLPIDDSTLAAILDSWLSKDHAAALTWVRQLPPTAREAYTVKAVGLLAAVDASAALQLVDGLASGIRRRAMVALAETWAAADAVAMSQWLLGLPRGPLQAELIAETCRTVAATSPQLAGELLLAAGPRRALQAKLRGLGYTAAGDDPEAILAWAGKLAPDPRQAVIHGVVLRLAASNRQRALQLFAELSGKARQGAAIGLTVAWLRSDPTGAVNWVTEQSDVRAGILADPTVRRLLRESYPEAVVMAPMTAAWDWEADEFLYSWAARDLPAALSHVEALPDDERELALPSVMTAWFDAAPEAALQYLDEHGLAWDEINRDEEDQAWLWGSRDYLGMIAWAKAHPDYAAADDFIREGFSSWAYDDPHAAATGLLSLPPGDARDRATLAVVSRWSPADPGHVAGWVANFPALPCRAEAIAIVARNWVDRDPTAAAAWALQQDDVSVRDAAVSAVAEHAADAAEAEALIAAITDPKLRQRTRDRRQGGGFEEFGEDFIRADD